MPRREITLAALKPATSAAPEHCYIQGTIAGRIRFRKLPLPVNWNGRLLAQPLNVLGLVLRHGVTLIGAGIAVGLIARTSRTDT
jgi:hypothetical protein